MIELPIFQENPWLVIPMFVIVFSLIGHTICKITDYLYKKGRDNV